jgi:hypothetical protein
VLLALNKEDNRAQISPYISTLPAVVLVVLLVAVLPPGLNKEELLRLIYLRAVVLAPVLNKEVDSIRFHQSTLAVELVVLLVAVLNKAELLRPFCLRVAAVAVLLVAVLPPVRWPDRNKEEACTTGRLALPCPVAAVAVLLVAVLPLAL